MNNTELLAHAPSRRTGFAATLRALLAFRGSGAPSLFRRHRTLTLLTLTTATLALTTSAALAVTPPVIEEVFVSDISGTSATLRARINPEGNETTYRFEYGPSEAYGSSLPVPDAIVGSGTTGLTVSAHPQNLSPSTTYHYRVVAENEIGETVGTDATFTTQPTGGPLVSLDGRQWELVSPPNKMGALIYYSSFERAAVSGDGIVYLASSPTESNPPGFGDGEGEWIFSRRVAGGWSTQDISEPQIEPTQSGRSGTDLRAFSADLSHSIVEPRVRVSLVPETPETVYSPLYLQDNLTLTDTPLITNANVAPGTPPDGANTTHFYPPYSNPSGATPDLSHVFLASVTPLTSTPVENGLYEWTAGNLRLVSFYENGEPGAVNYRSSREVFWTSRDGSRIVFEGEGLDLRDLTKGETVRLDKVQGGSGAGCCRLSPQLASGDGSRVYFSDDRHLTSDSSGSGRDLYECAMVEVAGKLTCELTDLTVALNPSEAGEFEGMFGASREDASYAYFVDSRILSSDAVGSEPGPRLYVRHNGTTTYVTTLIGGGPWNVIGGAQLSFRAPVSPNGRYAAFISEGSPTGYDNRDANTGNPDPEAYLYDAETGHLVCATCNPTGARPLGAAEIFVASEFGETHPVRRLFSDGRLIFSSPDALVPQDTNGVRDVYEYEPLASGGCRESSPTFSPASSGCIGLISSGTSDRPSDFLEASESGDDVFFLTSARLAPQDVDTAFDVYDAHVCSAAVPCSVSATPPPPCTTTESCRPAPLPQPSISGAPSSAAFNGPGNEHPRRKRHHRKKSRHHGSHQKRHANANRRAAK